MAVLGLHSFQWAFSVISEQEQGLLSDVEHRLYGAGFSSCGSRAVEHRLSSGGAWA